MISYTTSYVQTKIGYNWCYTFDGVRAYRIRHRTRYRILNARFPDVLYYTSIYYIARGT
jgi:hypothetical protein